MLPLLILFRGHNLGQKPYIILAIICFFRLNRIDFGINTRRFAGQKGLVFQSLLRYAIFAGMRRNNLRVSMTPASSLISPNNPMRAKCRRPHLRPFAALFRSKLLQD